MPQTNNLTSLSLYLTLIYMISTGHWVHSETYSLEDWIGDWQMGREFSLELGLWPSSSASEPNFQFSATPMMAMPFTLNHHQQIMVFYNGTLSFCDLTELQARAILLFASQERTSNTRWANPERLSLQLPKNGSGNAGFSIKKSLQRFLQRRKTRIRSMSPYHKL